MVQSYFLNKWKTYLVRLTYNSQSFYPSLLLMKCKFWKDQKPSVRTRYREFCVLRLFAFCILRWLMNSQMDDLRGVCKGFSPTCLPGHIYQPLRSIQVVRYPQEAMSCTAKLCTGLFSPMQWTNQTWNKAQFKQFYPAHSLQPHMYDGFQTTKGRTVTIPPGYNCRKGYIYVY